MCVLCQIDPQKQEAFGGKMLEVLNHSSLSYMLSIGHRTGLFDQMYQQLPMTSSEIADRAGLQERYVREWLASLVVAGVVEVSREQELMYQLPAEHGELLSRKGRESMAAFFQYFSVLGKAEDKVIDSFKNGGGVSYQEFDRFHQVMAEDSGMTVLPVLFDAIIPLVPGLQEGLESGIEVIDLACGSGKAINQMAERFPASRFTGVDLCLEPIETARAEAASKGLKNTEFIQADLSTWKTNRQFDWVTTFDGVHDQARPDLLLQKIYQILKPEGYYLMQDIDASSDLTQNLDLPLSTLLYTISTMHCMTVSLAQNGMGLGTMWGREKAVEMLQEAGFSQITLNRLPHDIQNYYMVIRK